MAKSSPPKNDDGFARRVSDERVPATLGQRTGEYLLRKYKEAHPEAAEDAHKWNMFSEIVMRDAFDISGNRFAQAKDGSYFSGFDDVFAKLQAQGKTGSEALDLVLRHLPAYTKGFVQTPHPTEVLSREAITAEQNLHQNLEHNRMYFGAGKTPPLDKEQLLLSNMHSLFNNLTPLNRQLTTDEEIARSVVFSEKMFDSVPIAVQMLLDAASRHGAYDNSKGLDHPQLLAFNFLIQPETWSPGDRDSKSEMTSEALQRGITLNKKAMALHYIKKLGEVLVENEKAPDAFKTQLREVMWKVMQGDPHAKNGENYLNAQDVEDYINKVLSKDTSAKVIDEIRKLHDVRYKHLPESTLTGTGMRLEDGYENNVQFLFDLDALRTMPDVKLARYRFSDGRKSSLSDLDMLAIQANNFGSSALRSQIRENAEVHSVVMEMVLNALHKRGIEVPGYDPNHKETAHKLEVIDAALDMLMDEKAYPGMGERIHEALMDKLASVRSIVRSAQDKQKQGIAIGDGEGDKMKLYETLRGFEIAAKNATSIPRYLIAECKSPGDILEAFFLLKAMEPDADRTRKDVPKVEIVPLLETRKAVENAPDIMLGAYKNRHFQEHHRMTDAIDPAINVFEDISYVSRPISVAEAKQMYGLEVRSGDYKRLIDSTKIVMFAGSDITKSVGTGGAGLVIQKTNELREKLLSLDKPVLLVDYTGAGGGIHRSQPVSSSYETVQGRSMRQSPSSIAQKMMTTLSHFIHKRLGLDDEVASVKASHHTQALTAQLNLGNLAGMPMQEHNWDHHLRERLASDMDKYQKLYTSLEFSAYLGFTADPFVKLTSYAARSASRARSKGDKGDFPPIVDVSNLRAIGYGGALNSSGSCASMYYGASNFLELGEHGNIPKQKLEELVQLYLHDPIAQDRINRATFGVVMADMDAAWAYLGYQRHVDKDGMVFVEKEDTTIDTFSLSHGDHETRHIKDKSPEQLSKQDKEALAVHALAQIDEEYQRVTRGLLQLHRALKKTGRLPLPIVGAMKSDAEQLLDELPKALREQIRQSRLHLDPERKHMAHLFQDILDGRQPVPSGRREDVPYYPEVYHAMGTCFEYFENVPRAYTRPSWAIGIEQEGLSTAR